MKTFTVLMFRWGIEDSHSYLLGNWDNVIMAELEARNEVENRDGKYDAVVYASTLNIGKEGNNAICTYRGIGFKDRIEGYHIEHSSFWGKMLEAFNFKK